MAHFCFIDESGDASLCDVSQPDSPPVFVLAALIVPSSRLKNLTWDYLQLKKQFEPRLLQGQLSDVVRHEIKGATLRKDLRRTGRRNTRRALGIIDKTLKLLEDHSCRIAGKVVVKKQGETLADTTVYAKAVQELAATFESSLVSASASGVMVLDSRTKTKNEGNVHSITTRRFRQGGDPYPHLLEAPLFGHSDTHVPLQIADLLASALIFPLACQVYASEHTWCTHLRNAENFAVLRTMFGARMQALEARYDSPDGRRVGGFHVEDRAGQRPTHLLFRP